MKNHIILKFIAVLLCAASLLGAVGSGLGIFLMTEMDLYDKTVDQVYNERIETNGRELAHKVGMHYASTQLGGTPEAMLEANFGYGDALYSSGFDPMYVGYALKDAEGNELDSRKLTYEGTYSTRTFPVTGQYMHFVDFVDREEDSHQSVDQMLSGSTLENGAVIIDTIPPEGAVLSEVTISSANGSHGAAGGNLGTVFRNRDGCIVARFPGFYIDELDPQVVAITLFDLNGSVVYDARWEEGIGMLFYAEDGTGDLIFTAFPAAAEEPVPQAVAEEETVPVTVPEEETVPAETVVEETVEETISEENAEGSDEAASNEEETFEDTESADGEEDPAEETTAEETDDSEEAYDSEEVTEEADYEEEAEPAEEGSEEEPAAEDEEAVEETAAPTVPETVPEETVPQETVPEETIPEPVMINGKPLNSYQINRATYHDAAGGPVTARYVYIPMEEMTLELYVQPGALRSEASFMLMRVVTSISQYLLPALGICLLLFAACAVYLCCAAGRSTKNEEIRPGGLNRLPLDLYGFAVLSGVVGVCLVLSEGGEYLLRSNVMVGIAAMAGMGYLASLLIVAFLFALVAQIKAPGFFWWHHSLCGLSVKLCLWLFKKFCKLCVWLEEWSACKGWPLVKRLVGWIWNRIRGFFRWIYEGLNRFLALLPVTWQWILAGAAMVLFLFITVAGRYDAGIVLAVLFAFGLVLYGAHCFGTLLEATRKMNKGDLDSKADDKLMVGAFKDFAEDLNDLAGVAIVAAQKQLKSERMKTELITNVSHDIRTPLTSIINYVDLLQKPHTEEEQEQYLEVLDRQSQRLKKLIDDLIDMSKASTGNMAVDITLVDAVESVNQALGEFADKLDRAQLIPVFRHTEDTVAMMADGRLVWRVLSNLLNNAVKYAMPGTRLYIDLMTLDNKVVISLKNISRDELNVDAEELMERFVRGDYSRNTEGSGLGLNIAKSLMELQKGQLQLLVDGDLFKVTLIFPGI